MDEQPFKANLEKIPTLKPAFRKDGTVTAANSSSISDGAAALVLMRAPPPRLGLTPLASIVAHARTRRSRRWFTTAPVGAIEKLYAKHRLEGRDVDLYEINEAFAVVAMAAMHEHGCRTRRSTCTAAPARWATRSAPPARASWSR
jgi:acetyl-CoA C-acetyltransferase